MSDSAFVIPGTTKTGYIAANSGHHPAIRFRYKVMGTSGTKAMNYKDVAKLAVDAAKGQDTEQDILEKCEEETLRQSEIVARHLIDWDAEIEPGKRAEITAENIASLDYFAHMKLTGIVAGWDTSDPDNPDEEPNNREGDKGN